VRSERGINNIIINQGIWDGQGT